MKIGFCLLLWSLAILNTAHSASFEEVDSWLNSEILLDPPTPGSKISQSDLKALIPWLPPGVLHEFDFPELQLEIQVYSEKKPHKHFLNASKKYLGTASIGADGSLLNYRAGQPFTHQQIVDANPKIAGYMIA